MNFKVIFYLILIFPTLLQAIRAVGQSCGSAARELFNQTPGIYAVQDAMNRAYSPGATHQELKEALTKIQRKLKESGSELTSGQIGLLIQFHSRRNS